MERQVVIPPPHLDHLVKRSSNNIGAVHDLHKLGIIKPTLRHKDTFYYKLTDKGKQYHQRFVAGAPNGYTFFQNTTILIPRVGAVFQDEKGRQRLITEVDKYIEEPLAKADHFNVYWKRPDKDTSSSIWLPYWYRWTTRANVRTVSV